MLESLVHEANAFVTLTYAPEHEPESGSLSAEHLTKWLKRLRKRVAPRLIRYFAVGEYGDRSERPHYHAALFNYPCCVGGPVRGGVCQCVACTDVRETWGFGHVMVGTLTEKSAQYIAGYVVKKMTADNDTRLAPGQVPEFARMSLRPGIGADALWDVASVMMQYSLEKQLPSQLRHGAKLLPLGRYLRNRLSKVLGQNEEERQSLSDQALSHLYEELSLVRSVAWATDKSVRQVFAEANAGYEQALIGKQTLKRKSL